MTQVILVVTQDMESSPIASRSYVARISSQRQDRGIRQPGLLERLFSPFRRSNTGLEERMNFCNGLIIIVNSNFDEEKSSEDDVS